MLEALALTLIYAEAERRPVGKLVSSQLKGKSMSDGDCSILGMSRLDPARSPDYF